jgi:uncharacterized membrane protein YebE (DUF533 family)
MFDSKNLLDALMRGGAQAPGQQSDLCGLEDLLRQLTSGGQSRQPGGVPGGSDGRGDALPGPMGSETREPSPGGLTPPSRGRRAFPSDDREPQQQAGSAQQSTGNLEDMLRNVLGGQSGSLSDVLGKLQQHGGGLADILGQVLGQATSGVREGAGRIDEATGASRYARDAIGQATGSSPEKMLARIKELMANNQLGTGAALGGLGALVLGTRTGRTLAGTAVKLGSLALISGLAYKAYQNYQQGQPVLTGTRAQQQSMLAAPEGSGFEPGAVSNEHATLLIRAMIATAAADGRIDEKEQQKILGGLRQARLEPAAQQFLAREIANPATVDDLANAVTSPQLGVQVYTAARIAVDPDREEEHEFLIALADRLGIDEDLAAHVDASARSAGA